MPFSEELASRIRTAVRSIEGVEETSKMGGLTFTKNGSVFVRAHSDGGMMLRCRPELTDDFLNRPGVKRFTMKGRSNMKGWLLVSADALTTQRALEFWIKVGFDALA